MRLTIPGHRPCEYTTHCAEIAMELASQGHKPRKGYGYNLPIDPRPTLDAIAQSLTTSLQGFGLEATVVKKPEPYGVGGAFRKERWFATVPQYQNPGTSEFAPEPGVMLEKPIPKKSAGPPRDPSAPLTPTKTWPQNSRWLAKGICGGQDDCEYEPKSNEIPRYQRSGCNRAWDTHSQALFEAFMKANPNVMFRDESLGCAGEIKPYHRCFTRKHRAMHGQPLDHAQLCRLPDGRKFIISQPYCDDRLCRSCLEQIALWQKEIPDLAWKDAGKEYSWYFPNQVNLLLLGTQETLDALILDYPAPTDTRPTGCQRWKEGQEKE